MPENSFTPHFAWENVDAFSLSRTHSFPRKGSSAELARALGLSEIGPAPLLSLRIRDKSRDLSTSLPPLKTRLRSSSSYCCGEGCTAAAPNPAAAWSRQGRGAPTAPMARKAREAGVAGRRILNSISLFVVICSGGRSMFSMLIFKNKQYKQRDHLNI